MLLLRVHVHEDDHQVQNESLLGARGVKANCSRSVSRTRAREKRLSLDQCYRNRTTSRSAALDGVRLFSSAAQRLHRSLSVYWPTRMSFSHRPRRFVTGAIFRDSVFVYEHVKCIFFDNVVGFVTLFPRSFYAKYDGLRKTNSFFLSLF